MNQVTKMNKHILIAMDWENRSLEELEKNRDVAYAAAADAAAAAYAAADAADSAYADAADSAYADAAYADDYVKYWLNRYFEITGENRKEYEKALKEMKK